MLAKGTHHTTDPVAEETAQFLEYQAEDNNWDEPSVSHESVSDIEDNDEIDRIKENGHNSDMPINEKSSFVADSYLDENGKIEITKEIFEAVPPNIRGRCKLENVEKCVNFIFEEFVFRFNSGYRGKHLHVERQHLLKYTGSHPGLHSVIMNVGLWRDIVSTLMELGLIQLDKDGSIIVACNES